MSYIPYSLVPQYTTDTSRSLKQRLYEHAQKIILFLFLIFFSYLILINSQEINVGTAASPSIRNILFSEGNSGIGIVFFLLVLVFLELDFTSVKSQFLRKISDEVGYHRLDGEEVLENENRQRIILAVHTEPGIHYNALLRECDLQPGQLQWHLKILTEYSILQQKRWGRYLMFFLTPSLTQNQKTHLKHPVLKSETTQIVFTLIQNNPGIQPSLIAKKLELNRNTIKYHTDKLIENGLVNSSKEGRSLLLYESKEQNPVEWQKPANQL
jgi:predicted transcriptional regulator